MPQLIGRYKILSELGRGSMGRVYLALDPNIDRKVALKVLAPLRDVGTQAEAELQRRFVLEARAAGRLKHPGIVTVYDAETDAKSGSSFIAMEWVDGQSLEGLLQQSGALPVPQAIAIVEQVAVALDSAHREELVHRDIKPANILLDRSGRAKISDFGIAKFTAMSHTVAGQILGSPYYMSPEQIRDETIDRRSDLFSLGVVLYQVVTGVVPFNGDSMASITYKILEIDPDAPQSINPEVSDALVAVIDRALAKSSADRFQTATEFAQSLRALDNRVDGGVGAQPVDSAAWGARTASPASDSSRLQRKETGTIFLATPRAASENAPGRPSLRASRLEKLVGDASTLSRKLWAAFSSRPRLSFAVLVPLLLLALLITLRPRQPEPSSPAARSTPSENRDPSALAEQSSTVPPRARETPMPAGWATLDITYRNRLRSALLTIWIDGEKSWSERVTTPEGIFQRASGSSVHANVLVPEGGHVIEVRIDGSEGRVHVGKRIEAVFEPGETRRLKVVLVPPNILRLSWKG